MPRSLPALLLALTALALLGAAPATALPPQDVDTDWIVDNGIRAMARDGQTLYIGGSFERLSPRTGSGVRFTPQGEYVEGPEFTRMVHTAIPDGSDGFYVGGYFEYVDGAPVSKVVHLLADGTLDPAFQAPPIDDSVYTLALAEDRLFLGGAFAEIGGQPRIALAALDRTTGALDPNFHPGVRSYSGSVSDIGLSPDGTTLYAAGSFACVGAFNANNDCGDIASEMNRRNAAAFATANGAVRQWAPNTQAGLLSLEVSDEGTVFLGGTFSCLNTPDDDCGDGDVGEDTRRQLAEVDGTTGQTTPFIRDVGASGGGPGYVTDLLLEGDELTVVGEFSCVGWTGDDDCTDTGESARHNAFRISTGGFLYAWNPNVKGVVSGVAHVPGGPYWLGGRFSEVGGQPRNDLAIVDPETGALSSIDPAPNGSIDTLAFSGGHVFAGGSFTGAGGVARRNLAAIDLQTGRPTEFDPRPDYTVYALATANGRLYAGGSFQNIAGAARKRLAAFDLASGALTDWNPGANLAVLTIAPTADRVYVGGEFTQVGGSALKYLAALGADTGAPLLGFPIAQGRVHALALDAGRLYAGGEFAGSGSFGGTDRDGLAAVDLATKEVADWAPRTDYPVHAVAAAAGRVYAGGFFGEIDGVARRRVAAVAGDTGEVLDWNAGLEESGVVETLAVDGDTLALGGQFRFDDGAGPENAALLATADGARRDWDPRLGSDVLALDLAGGALYAGGSFNNVGLLPQEGLATFTPPPVNLTPPSLRDTGAGFECDPGRWEGNPLLTPSLLEAGSLLSCRVTARNIRGEATAESAAVTIPGGTGPNPDSDDKQGDKPAITLAAHTGKGVRRTKSGRYVVRFGSALRVFGTVTGANGAPVVITRPGAKPLTVKTDAKGGFSARIKRPKRGLRLVATVAGVSAQLRAAVTARLRFAARRLNGVTAVAGRVVVPKGGRGRIELRRAGTVVARLLVKKAGPFAVTVKGTGALRVRFVPKSGSGLTAVAARIRVRRR